MEKYSVSVIIVNYNGKKWIKNCLESLKNQNGINLEIIIVDNNSKDGSLDYIEKYYPEVKVIVLKINKGFGYANNIGAIKASHKYIFFINTDVQIIDRNLIKLLLTAKIRQKAAIIGPKILDFNNNDLYKNKKLGIDIFSYPGLSKFQFYIEGCALMVTKNDFVRLGMFDDKYFMYSEDIDLCWRARLLGLKVYLESNLSLNHFGGGSSTSTIKRYGLRHSVPIFRRYEVEKNNLRNIIKNFGSISGIITPLYLVLSLAESLFYIFIGNMKLSKTIISAIVWNIRNLPDTIERRKIIQKNRKVRDLDILKNMTIFPNKLVSFINIGIPIYK